jgi:lipopolysaccharide export system permease protein
VTSHLGRYLVREVAGLYLLGVVALCLLLSIDLLSVLARFLVEHQASAATVARLLLFKLPWFLHLTLPVAVLFAILVATGRLSKDAELKAAYAGGVHPLRLLGPLIAFGALITLVSIGVNGYLEPWGEAAYQREIQSFLYARPPTASQVDAAFAIEGVGTYFAARVRADRNDPSLADLTGVLVIMADGTTMTASSGVWDSATRTWRLNAARVTPAGASLAEAGPTLSIPFPLESSAEQTLTRPTQQTITELADRVRDLRQAGAALENARFELQRRLADATAAVVFALAAGSLALRVRGRGAGLGWTIALVVAFWASWTLTGTLFDRGVVGAWTAAWSTPAAVAVIGALLALRVAWR